VSPTIAQTIGARNGLAEHIGQREMLLLLDNLEQVVEAAPDLAALVEACPGLRLLATSRELLRVRGEVEYPVAPLAEEEAIALFGARSRLGADATIAELCRRLDNLPLAVELAAAGTSVLSPGQILARLGQRLDLLKGGRDADPRQQTLRATIEWSHELLTADEQRLFAGLSVFAGGSSLEAAQEVAEADLDTLRSLVDKSLLRHTEERFWMLETIREYAAERLQASGEEETIRARHLDHFLALAERAYAEQRTAESTWFPVMSVERDNIRAALDWAGKSSPRSEVELASAVAFYWFVQGHVREAHDRVTGALSRHDAKGPIRARALTQLGKIDPRAFEARTRLDEAVALWREAGDQLGEGLALEAIGDTYLYAGEYPPAQRAYELSLAIRRQAGAPEIEGAEALGGLCQLLVASGEIERVEPMARELYELGRRYGNRDAQMNGLHYLADCPLIAGDYTEAEERYRRALGHAHGSGFMAQVPTELIGIAMSAAGQGDATRAVRLAAAASAQRETLGLKPGNPAHWWIKLQQRHIAGARAQLGPDEAARAERAGREASFEAILDEVLGRSESVRAVAVGGTVLPALERPG
jgi:predicted ATPase